MPKKIVLVLVFFLSFLIPNALAEVCINFTEHGPLFDEPGTYYLCPDYYYATDCIGHWGNCYVLDIRADDVYIDFQGSTIDAHGWYGIYANGPDCHPGGDPVHTYECWNITLVNCGIYNAFWSEFFKVYPLTLKNCHLWHSTCGGLSTEHMPVYIIDSNITENNCPSYGSCAPHFDIKLTNSHAFVRNTTFDWYWNHAGGTLDIGWWLDVYVYRETPAEGFDVEVNTSDNKVYTRGVTDETGIYHSFGIEYRHNDGYSQLFDCEAQTKTRKAPLTIFINGSYTDATQICYYEDTAVLDITEDSLVEFYLTDPLWCKSILPPPPCRAMICPGVNPEMKLTSLAITQLCRFMNWMVCNPIFFGILIVLIILGLLFIIMKRESIPQWWDF